MLTGLSGRLFRSYWPGELILGRAAGLGLGVALVFPLGLPVGLRRLSLGALPLAVTLRLVPNARSPGRSAAVGGIEPGALKDDPDRVEDAVHLGPANPAALQRWVGERLHDLELVSVLLAPVSICRHRCPRSSPACRSIKPGSSREPGSWRAITKPEAGLGQK